MLKPGWVFGLVLSAELVAEIEKIVEFSRIIVALLIRLEKGAPQIILAPDYGLLVGFLGSSSGLQGMNGHFRWALKAGGDDRAAGST